MERGVGNEGMCGEEKGGKYVSGKRKKNISVHGFFFKKANLQLFFPIFHSIFYEML